MKYLPKKNSILFIILSVFISIQSSFGQNEEHILSTGEFAPEFQLRDIDGNEHSLKKYKGKKILLSFYRNAGCPICNYRFHELEDEEKYFKEKDLVLISVYESSIENLKLLIDTNKYYQHIVSDDEGLLYFKYGVAENRTKIVKGFLHGARQKAYKGKQRFTTKIKQDGNPNRIAADFLIDENGNIIIAYYGKYLGDRLPIEDIKSKLN
jgi:thioredoxin-dependent peroxiredoxin